MVRTLNQTLANIMLTDASDAPQRLGGEESPLYENLKWSAQVELTLGNGLEATVRELQQHHEGIATLPDVGVPGQLRHDLAEDLELVQQRLGQESFYRHAADLRTILTTIQTRTRDATVAMAATQQKSIQEAQSDLQRLATWTELRQDEQALVLGQLEALTVAAPSNLSGLKQLLNQEFMIQSRLSDLKRSIEQRGRERQLDRQREEQERGTREGRKAVKRTVNVPAKLQSTVQLNALIAQFETIRDEVALYDEIDITLQVVQDTTTD